MTELKECPFCESEIIYAGTGMGIKFGKCSNSHCAASEIKMPMTTWKNRPIEDALRAENERLREVVEFAIKTMNNNLNLSIPGTSKSQFEWFITVAKEALEEK